MVLLTPGLTTDFRVCPAVSGVSRQICDELGRLPGPGFNHQDLGFLVTTIQVLLTSRDYLDSAVGKVLPTSIVIVAYHELLGAIDPLSLFPPTGEDNIDCTQLHVVNDDVRRTVEPSVRKPVAARIYM